MNTRKSIEEHIQTLARNTGAPLSFVEQVRALFLTKGISLDEEAAPFLEALDEAFSREERIRLEARRTREGLAQTQTAEAYRRAGEAYIERVSNLDAQGRALPERGRRLVRHVGAGPQAATTRVSVRGSHRALVTRPEREDVPLVPGPSELQ
jgi:hypothetical protein